MQDLAVARQVAIEAARGAGQIIKRNFRKTTGIRYKGKANIVTDVDLKAEQAIVEVINRQFPQHNILTEEVHTAQKGSEFTWVIDPLDGTFNYASGIPVFATSVALVHQEKPLLGVVLEPLRGDLFLAEVGQGARLNDRRIHVSTKTSLQDALVGVDIGYEEDGRRRALETVAALRPSVQAFRVMGSAVLGICYAACGIFDVYFHPRLYPWDVAAAKLIVEEAGGVVTDGLGGAHSIRSQSIVAASPALIEQFLSVALPHLAPA
ncbi:MAG: inositol monophosphatase [Chloroflexi bacterium]|nr:inositol monophosphatase [Chloroflexota bacterium]